MRRFWEAADVVATESGWSVRLDGKSLHIPGGARLSLATRALADAVAAEWQAAADGVKGGETSYDHLPLTRLAGTTQQRILPDPEPVALAIARYAESDLLCYRATVPETLVRREAAAWDPWLDWLWRTHRARLHVTAGVIHAAQDPDALAAVAAAVARLPASGLAALGVAVPALGSIVLGLAMADGAIDADRAYALSVLDEDFQAEQWGRDAEAQRRADRVCADVLLAGRFLSLSRP